MATVTGIFASPAEAENAMHSLRAHGFEESQINLLARGESSFPVHGTQAGAAIGAFVGLSAATFLPGLGPVVGMGMIATGLIGTGLGAAAGAAIDRHTHGVPNEELYFYEEAVRNGQPVVIVEAHDQTQATQARNLLERGGGRSVQSLRREWWQSLRDDERAYLRHQGRELEPNEPAYRSGFEAALHPATRGRDLTDVVTYVEECYPEPCKTEVFRIGYDRGQEYFRRRMAARETE
ncbi:MAG TPA: hypothetical protein VGS96_17525 [Thermoanaerobaculia bacterium]|jgi:outer membrane lipoprotein SlyB|nr:hypothetical protein [Thermoanaerobaculia bacterium]